MNLVEQGIEPGPSNSSALARTGEGYPTHCTTQSVLCYNSPTYGTT